MRAVTQDRDGIIQRRRSVIVPIGTLKHNVEGPHVRVRVENNGIYGRFTVNETLGRLDCPAEPRLLYLKAQFHAYTSFVLPDVLTGRTGTEEALHCLKSGYCQPWTPLAEYHYSILSSIAKLTPRREYYPIDMKAKQKVSWNAQLTTTIQHDYLRTVVQEIYQKSEQLSAFSLPKPETPPLESAGPVHLVLRSHIRRQAYQRPNVVSGEEQMPPDLIYRARDRLETRSGHANILECMKAIRDWPTSLYTTSDLAGILQGWMTIGGSRGSVEKILLTDLLKVDFAADFVSLVNFCRRCSADDSHRLMFLFAIMSFPDNVPMDVLRVLLALCIFVELKVLEPPRWSVFTQFRHGQIPRAEYLMQLMKTSLIPYAGDERTTFEFQLNSKQRRKLEAIEVAYKEQQENDMKLLAQHFLDQWPCLEPRLEGFASSVLIDTVKALEIIRPEWERLFQNWELSQYLDEVQKVLDKHHSEPNPDSGSADCKEQEVLAARIRGGEFPDLQSFLCKSGPPVTLDTLPLIPTCLPLSKHTNSILPLPRAAFEDKKPDGRLVKPSQAHRSHHPLFREIRELQVIIENLTGSKSIVRQQYGDDLNTSLRAFQKTDVGSKKDYELLNLTRLSSQIAYAQSVIQREFNALCKAFELDDSRVQWLQQCALWPCVTPITVLETLRSTSTCHFGDRVKESLVRYAVAITSLQRLLRMEDALQLGNTQRLHEEQDNPGHQNWKPAENCDWLLLEIDSNFMIRPTQIEVTLEMCTPASETNSAMQMNMGQGEYD